MSAKIIMIVHSSSNFSNGKKKTFNYNHKPQYIAIKTCPIMLCALPSSALLTFSMSISKNLYSGTSSSI